MERLITSALISLIMAMGLLLLLGAPQTFGATETIKLNENTLNDNSSFDVGELLITTGQAQSYLNDPNQSSPVVAFILDIINFITRVIGVICMLFIIVGGLMMIVSEGEDNRIQKGKEIVTAAIIGLIIVMASYIIVRFFQSLFYLEAP